MTDLITRIQQAIHGLAFPSETDAPLQVFVWNNDAPFSIEALLADGGYPEGTPTKTISVDRFFRSATTLRAWHGPVERERVRRFQALVDLFKTELSDVNVYKIGSASIDVYVVGRDGDGNYLGITTWVVET